MQNYVETKFCLCYNIFGVFFCIFFIKTVNYHNIMIRSVIFLKKLVIFFSALCLCLTTHVYAEAVDISAKSAVVIDSVSKRVLYEKDAYSKRGMASTTKIMTALLTLELLDGEDVVTVSPYASGTEGSSIWLSPGEKITVSDLLYGLLLSSGNDAATALAEQVAGSVDAFTQLMNKRAMEIGCTDTNFTNPHGLPDDNHYTTAYDLALISAEAMKNKTFREIVSTVNKTISWEGSRWNRSLSNHNKLLKKYEYAIGIKTGYTKKDGRCLVSSSRKDEREIIVVTLSAPDDWNDHMNLSEYCFEHFVPVTITKAGENAGVLVDKSGLNEDIHMIFENGYTISMLPDEDRTLSKELCFEPNFPVKKGDKIGVCSFFSQGQRICDINLISANDAIIKNDFISIIKQLMKGLVYR